MMLELKKKSWFDMKYIRKYFSVERSLTPYCTWLVYFCRDA